MIYVKRKCKNCGKDYCDEKASRFVTCGQCRNPVPGDQLADGCHFWQSAAPDPRVTRAKDINTFSMGELLS